jgi:hypothetical protein
MLCYYVECHYAECRILFTLMLNIVILSVIAPKASVLQLHSVGKPFLIYEQKSIVVNMTHGTVFTTLHFLGNLCMGSIS